MLHTSRVSASSWHIAQRLVLCGFIFGLARCSSERPNGLAVQGSTIPVVSIVSPWYNGQEATDLEDLAKGLAAALSDRAVSAVVLSTLQGSPWSEHKVNLAEFLSSGGGKPVLDATAGHMGMAAGSLKALVQSLPPIDLYVPFRVHRHSWHAGEPIAVAALVDTSSPLVAHLPGEAQVAIDRWSTTPPGIALLLLGPAETKVLRSKQATGSSPSSVIEGDEEFSHAIQALQCLDCPPGGGGGTSGGTTGPLRLLVISTSHVCDNGFCGEGNEFEFRATANGVHQSPTMRCTGIPSTATIQISTWPNCNTTVVHSVAPPTAAFVDVDVVETDGLSSDDSFRNYISPPAPWASAIPRIVDNTSHQLGFLLYKFDTVLSCFPPILSWNPYCYNVQFIFKW